MSNRSSVWLVGWVALIIPVGACTDSRPELLQPSLLPLPCLPWDEANGPAPPCDGDSGGGNEDPSPGAPGYWLPGMEVAGCFAAGAWDPDNDGMANDCENVLAQAFAPGLWFMRDCNWDNRFARMGGEYYFAVQRAPGQEYDAARIAYLPAYYLDCGTPHDAISLCGASQLTPLTDGACAGHTGDSELIMLDISFDWNTRHWVADSVFLSAHCAFGPVGYGVGGGKVNGCNWFDWNQFEFVDIARGAPVIWVAEGKHANYRSQSLCNSGAVAQQDTCDANTAFHRYPTGNGQQNIGSRASPLRDCAAPLTGSAYGSPQVNPIECMWTPTSLFRGWWGDWLPGSLEVTGAKPYSTVLQRLAGL